MSKFFVAETILKTLGGAGRLKAMIGAKNFAAKEDGNSVAFKIGGGASKGINYIKITLNAMDLYDVEFLKLRKFEFKTVAEENGIYNDMLRGVIEENTGMYLSF